LLEPYRLLFKHRYQIWALVRREVASRYTGTALGLVWLVFFPLLFLGIYSFVFSFIFKVTGPKGGDSIDYILLVFAGLVPFLAFAETLSQSTPSIVANKDLVTLTMFRAELIPIRFVGATAVSLAVGLSMVMLLAWWKGVFHATQLLIPLVMLIQLFFLVGLGWLCSTTQVFFRDFNQIVGLLTIVLMLVSPIAFDRSMLTPGLAGISSCNPLFPLIELYRDVILRGEVGAENVLLSLCIALGSFHVGYFVITRLKVAFGDYL